MSARDPSSPFDGEWGISSFYAIGGNTLLGLARRKPSRLLVLGDVFHSAYAEDAIDRVFAVMALQPQHTFFVLTENPERMRNYLASENRRTAVSSAMLLIDDQWTNGAPVVGAIMSGIWPLPNVWLGVSVEDQATADARIPLLLQTPAAHRFVSYEPAIGPVDFGSIRFDRHSRFNVLEGAGTDNRSPCQSIPNASCNRIDWLIAGGESGPGARPFDVAWARQAVAQCKAARVPCFVKQLGARPVCSAFPLPVQQSAESIAAHGEYDPDAEVLRLKSRKGSDPSEWPADLRVREVPACG